MNLEEDIRAATDIIRVSDDITIISHIDADGISSESILFQALNRQGITVKSIFVRQLDPLTLDQIPNDSSVKIFSDLGSGQQQFLIEKGLDPSRTIIIDHHVSQPAKTLSGDGFIEVNCLNHGYEKMSAAGVSYLLARAIDEINVDLARLAIIGNVGDMMDREHLRFTGPVREILQDGLKYGDVELWEHDLNIYGISTRPLPQSLAYSDDMDIPGVSREPEGAARFLEKIGILPSQKNRWPVWEELSFEQKQIVCSAVIEQLIAHGKDTSRMFSDHYIFPEEARNQASLRNASEFATLLNSCGRWQRPELGSAICRGDRNDAYREAEYMLRNHRSRIREVMLYITDTGVSELSHLHYIHVHDRFPDTIVGIGAGMALSRLNPQKPILVMCEDSLDPSMTKISMRTKPDVVKKGVDLQQALSMACELHKGCSGGGHRIAAGAFIPRDLEGVFIDDVNRIISEQYAQSCQDNR